MRTARCKESICIYGISGAGKTTKIEEFALVVKHALGKDKIVRLASVSGGGWKCIQPSIDEGLIKPCWLRSRDYATYTIDKITKGWWPSDPEDPLSKLVPPDQQPDWPLVGGIAFETGTEMCNWIMEDGLEREAESGGKFRMGSEGASHIYKDGPAGEEEAYAAAAKAHYGATQNRIGQFINQSKDIEDRFVLWTFLEGKGKDPVFKQACYGPDVIGQALTGDVPSWFDRTLRIAVSVQANVITRSLFTNVHFEGNDPIPYLANARAPKQSPIPLALKGLDFDLFRFYELLTQSYAKAREVIKARQLKKAK